MHCAFGTMHIGAIQVLRNADGGGCQLFRKKRYAGVRFNVISITRGGWGSDLPSLKIRNG